MICIIIADAIDFFKRLRAKKRTPRLWASAEPVDQISGTLTSTSWPQALERMMPSMMA